MSRGGSDNWDGHLNLLSLDGGGVRGLSSLMILKNIMENLNPDSPPLPCDYFDMIGGTSTGGLIAIMLGRLKMSVDDCIDEYKKLSPRIFTKIHHRITVTGRIQGRFDHVALENGIKDLLRRRGLDEETLFKEDLQAQKCKT